MNCPICGTADENIPHGHFHYINGKRIYPKDVIIIDENGKEDFAASVAFVKEMLLNEFRRKNQEMICMSPKQIEDCKKAGLI